MRSSFVSSTRARPVAGSWLEAQPAASSSSARRAAPRRGRGISNTARTSGAARGAPAFLGELVYLFNKAHMTAFPREPIDRVTAPMARFLHVEAASGGVLLFFTALALLLANSPWADPFLALWRTPVSFGVGDAVVSHSLHHWINDGLMAVFFFVIGLEVKRELVLGYLRDLRTAALPIAAALGGMVAPAGIYLALQLGEPGEAGWGIPMATDIAFVVGCLALLGPRVPHGLRVLLLTLAIADDIGAILVIAVGYTAHLDVGALAAGAAGIGLVIAAQRLGVRSVGVYTLLGAAVWWCFHASGVHATIAGVILGLLTPTGSWVSRGLLAETVGRASEFLHGEGWERDPGSGQRALLRQVETAAREGVSPLERLEERLHPWVSFGIMPLFAFANAGVPFDPSSLRDPVAVSVAVGLFLGKPLGIVAFSFAAVRLGLARLPERVTWGMVAAGGCLAGIGFTMALFIAGLALDEDALDAAKVGVLGASALAALLGMALLSRLLPARDTADPEAARH